MKKDCFYIYFLLKRKEVVYIGHSKNVHVRQNAHNDKPHDSIRFMPCASKEMALMYEKRWIAKFKPKFNVNGINERRKPYGRIRPIETLIEKKKTSVRVSMSIDYRLFEAATELSEQQDRTLGNYITWCLLRGVRSDNVMYTNFKKSKEIMKIA